MKDNFFEDLLDADKAQKHIEQGSEEWEAIRCGRFTASDIFKLMEPGKREMTAEEKAARPKKGVGSSVTTAPDHDKLTEGALTYVRQKVAETLTGRLKPSAYAYPLVYGKEMEQEAAEYFQEMSGLEVTPIGFCPFTDHAGGSPDRDIPEDDSFLELKCPYQSENHINYLMLTDHFDLKRMHPDYYWQIQSNILFTGRSKAWFAAYDPRFIEKKLRMQRIEIPKVEADQKLIIKKIELAIKEKLSLIKTLTA